MKPTVHGIHHVTAIAGDPLENIDFYVRVLGMRLVKKSVNQDAPDTYHLFYADGVGSPGTDLTFFPWPDLQSARRGTGFTVEVSFAIPEGSLAYWQERFDAEGVHHGDVETRFGETALPFQDPHGLHLALVETSGERPFVPWEKSTVPSEHQLRGMHVVRLWEQDLTPTETLLTDVMGFTAQDTEDGWHRYHVDDGAPGTIIDVKALPSKRRGSGGQGSIHHVAWRVTDGEEQMAVRNAVAQAGLRPTQQIDRFWFKSVYFREPGSVLFELATDGPGFERDEPLEHLGEQLILPPWLESRREEIEATLPSLEVPAAK